MVEREGKKVYRPKKKYTFFLTGGAGQGGIILFCFLFIFFTLSAGAQNSPPGNSQPLFEACEAIIDKSLDNVLQDLVRIKTENRELKATLEEYRRRLEAAAPEETGQLRTEIQKLRKKIEGYKSSLADTLEKIQTEKNKNEKLQDALTELKESVSALKIEYNTLLEESARQHRRQLTQRQTIEDLKLKNRNLSGLLKEKKAEIDRWKEKADPSGREDLETKLKDHQSLSRQYQMQLDQQRSQLRKNEETIASLKEELSRRQQISRQAREKNKSEAAAADQNRRIITGLKGELLRIKERLSEKEALLAQSQQKLAQTEEQLETARAGSEEYRSRLQTEETAAKTAAEDRKEMSRQLRQAREKNQSEAAAADQNRRIISDLKGELLRVKERLSEKETLLAQSQQKLTQTKEQLGTARAESEEYRSRLQAEETAAQTAEGNRKEMSRQLRRAQGKIDSLQSQTQQLIQNVNKLTRQNESLRKAKTEIVSGENQRNREVAALKEELTQARQALTEKNRIIAERENVRSRDQSRIKGLEAQHRQCQDQLRQRDNELAASTGRIGDLEEKLKEKESSASQTQQTLKRQVTEKQDELASLMQKNRALRRQVESLRNEQSRGKEDRIQSLKVTVGEKSETVSRLESELKEANRERTRTRRRIEEMQATIEEITSQNSELTNQSASLKNVFDQEKSKYARSMQNLQNKIDNLKSSLGEKENVISALQDKVDQYTRIVPEGQLRTQEKYFEKIKELKNSIAECNRRHEESREELRSLLRNQNQSRDTTSTLHKTIKALEQENLDLLKEAEALNKTIYSLGLGGELERTKEILEQRQQRQEKYYTKELKDYAQQVDALGEVVREYEVTVAEVITLLDSIPIDAPRQKRHAAELRKKLHALQSTTW